MPKIVDKEAKRISLIEAAARVFARDGFAATKMAHVAREADVGKGTLYEYFTSKDELFLSVCQHCVDWPDIAAFVEEPKEGLKPLILSLAESYERATGFFSILIDYWAVIIREPGAHGDMFLSRGAAFYEQPLALISQVVVAGRARGVFRADADPMMVARTAIAGIEGLRLQRALQPTSFEIIGAISGFADLLVGDLLIED